MSSASTHQRVGYIRANGKIGDCPDAVSLILAFDTHKKLGERGLSIF
uniref:Uncharacterized protein n=1 Tax=Anguilla anguilla TaxID=7936 RepID=A0A0E9VTX0_ANGAN